MKVSVIKTSSYPEMLKVAYELFELGYESEVSLSEFKNGNNLVCVFGKMFIQTNDYKKLFDKCDYYESIDLFLKNKPIEKKGEKEKVEKVEEKKETIYTLGRFLRCVVIDSEKIKVLLVDDEGRQQDEFIVNKSDLVELSNWTKRYKEYRDWRLSILDKTKVKNYRKTSGIVVLLPDGLRKQIYETIKLTNVPVRNDGTKPSGNDFLAINSDFKSGLYGDYVTSWANHHISSDESQLVKLDTFMSIIYQMDEHLSKLVKPFVIKTDKKDFEFVYKQQDDGTGHNLRIGCKIMDPTNLIKLIENEKI